MRRETQQHRTRGLDPAKLLDDLVLLVGVGRARTGIDDRVDALRAQPSDVRDLLVGVAIGLAHDHREAVDERDVFDPAHDARVELVAEVVHQDAHDVGALHHEAAGEQVGLEVELGRGGHHLGPGGLGHRVLAAREHPGRGGDGDPGPSGDVGERGEAGRTT